MKRIFTALVLLAVFVPVLVFSHTAAYPVFLALAGIMCVWETSRCKGLHKKHFLWIPSALYVGFAPFSARMDTKIFLVVSLVFLVYIWFSGVFYYGKTNINELSYLGFMGFYIALGVYSVVAVRDAWPTLYLLVFVAPWVSDAMAMYTGKLFGKRKLCPNISPKKTVAGAVGSMVGTMLVTLVHLFVVNTWFGCEYSYLLFGLCAIPAGIIIQLGDLSASVVKRNCGVKDYGNLLPGHGGVMDRCDSILPTAIFAFLLSFLLV